MKLSNVYVTAHAIEKRVIPSGPCPIVEDEPTIISQTNLKSVMKANIKSHNGKLDIYFGSNTGTCENIAHQIFHDAKQFGFDTAINALDVVEPEGFKKDRLTLIVCSTYNGQPPNNAKKLAEYCSNLKPASLSDINLAILGVGNSNWKSFQAFPIYLENSLRSAGAKFICGRGIADEEKDIQEDVHSWFDLKFWPCVFESVGLNPNTSRMDLTKVDHDYKKSLGLVVTNSTELSRQILRSPGNQFATVTATRELQSSDSGRSTRHIEFKLPSDMEYHTGDHLAVFPENDPELVLDFASLINEHDLGRVVKVTLKSDGGKEFRHLPIGVPTKVLDLLSRHIDLQAPITTSFVKAAVDSTVDPEQHDILKGIYELMFNGVTGHWQQLRPSQVLTAFPSVCMTLEDVLPTIRPMKKRYYSISSSPLASKEGTKTVSVTVGVVEGTTANNPIMQSAQIKSKNFRGVCSGYLAGLRRGQLAEIVVATNERFRLPSNALTPVILVGAGTGVAPFRGFLHELNKSKEYRPAMLFFGCRNENDYLYRSELESSSVELHVAFSRPNSAKVSRNYVQDLLWEHRNRVWKLFQDGAHMYVCGDARMAKGVDERLCRIAMDQGKMNEENAITFFEQLQKNHKYLQDVW